MDYVVRMVVSLTGQYRLSKLLHLYEVHMRQQTVSGERGVSRHS
jgi:hypothetical protein